MARRSIEAVAGAGHLRRDELDLGSAERPFPCQFEHLRATAVRSSTSARHVVFVRGTRERRARHVRQELRSVIGMKRRRLRRRRDAGGGGARRSAGAARVRAFPGRPRVHVDRHDDRGHRDELGVAGVTEFVDLALRPASRQVPGVVDDAVDDLDRSGRRGRPRDPWRSATAPGLSASTSRLAQLARTRRARSPRGPPGARRRVPPIAWRAPTRRVSRRGATRRRH